MFLVMKAIVLLACAALAIKQVVFFIEEYKSPARTLYTVDDVESIAAPAFTVCPKPSGNTFNNTPGLKYFNATSVSLRDVISKAPGPELSSTTTTRINREAITRSVNGVGHWRERTFWETTGGGKGGVFFKCFTLFLKENVTMGRRNSTDPSMAFTFQFKGIQNFPEPKIEVFVHDQLENFTYLDTFKAEPVVLYGGSTIELSIRPEIVQNSGRNGNRCSEEVGYSYTTCMETCFWNFVQPRHEISCLSPSLLTDDVILRKPECRYVEEGQLLERLDEARNDFRNRSGNCNCSIRCITTNYRILAVLTAEGVKNDESSSLSFSFPSSRVPRLEHQPEWSILHLMFHIGKVVGICLGVMCILLICDVIEEARSSARWKSLQGSSDATHRRKY
ncbi:unnamed protein product [Darwinula stevensoni]|uniref:Uncharacterized protein n=1 Tax=Darwinula stevensoni TaxID=69355 RepID=A0A7R8XG95_9CRUS|nr:unnamed protein product [Darwinula stevensoni]CAG0896072.1 unnamed protein product [Darwinula stevensoni]